MMKVGFEALLSHWWRHKLQFLTLVVGLSLATGLWVGVQAINAQARLSYDEAAAVLAQDRFPRITGPLTLADFAAARRAGWPVTPIVDTRFPGTRLRLLGVDPFTTPVVAGIPDLAGAGDLTAFLTGELIFVAPDAEADLPAGAPEARPLDSLAPGVVLADIAVAQQLLRDDRLTHLLLLGDQPGPLDDIFTGVRLEQPQAGTDIANLTDSFHLNLTAFGLLAFAVGLFIVHAAIGLAFEQRRPLFRTLRALGLSSRHLTLLLGVELGMFTAVGGLLGILMGYGVAAALLPGVTATLEGLYGAQVAGGLRLAPVWWLSGFAMAGIGLAVAGGQSLWQLARLPVLASAMPRAWAQTRGIVLVRQGVAGVLLVAVAGLLAIFGQGLIAGFAGLAALLIGAALLLPMTLVWLIGMGGRQARGPVAEWLWADTRQQVPGLSLALMALLLALSANIGVGTMVGSFRATFEGWLDQRLASELYLTARDETEAAVLLGTLENRVDAILPILSADITLEGAPADLFGVADHGTYRDHWPVLEGEDDLWDRLASGQGVLVNEQAARRFDLWPGQRAQLGAAGEWEVLGVYSDYGNPKGQAMMGLGAFEAIFPDVPQLRFALRVPEAAASGLQDELVETFDLGQTQMVNQSQIKAFSLDVFEQTFAVTAALNVLTLGVAAFALWATLTTLASMRLSQVAPVWALGLTRRQLALADLARALALAVATAMLAVPVGLALAWVLLAVVNVQAFGWRLPLIVDALSWLWLGFWALLAAGAAAALPAWRLWRVPPADLVKVFAHER